MPSRIVGMGEILTIEDLAETAFKEEEARQLEQKVRNATFDFEDFLSQLERINKMGGLISLLKFLPGMNNFPKELLDEKVIKRTEAIIRSMTPTERKLPETINASRRNRIAKGSGVTAQAVTDQIRNFMSMREVMAKISGGGAPSMMNTLFGGGAGMANLAGMMQRNEFRGTGQAAGYASNGASHQSAAHAAKLKAQKDARRKMAEKSKKRNRKK